MKCISEISKLMMVASLSMLSLLFLGGCQGPSSDSVTRNFQMRANLTLGTMAERIDLARRGMMAAAGSGGARGLASNSNLTLAPPMFGNFGYYSPDMGVEVQTCLAQSSSIVNGGNFPKNQHTYVAVMGMLAQCFDRVLMRNATMTYGFRQLDPQSQLFMGYNMDWRGSGSLYGWNFNPQLFSGLQGLPTNLTLPPFCAPGQYCPQSGH